MRIALVGGGSGGHFHPLMAVADELAASDTKPRLYYIGPTPYSETDLSARNITYVHCPAGKLRRYFSVQNFFDLFRTGFGFLVAIGILYRIYPDVIFSKGSYTAVPILLAARILAIPIVIHESDSVPGRANMLVAKSARYIGVAYDDASQYFPAERTALVGIPLRPDIKAKLDDPFATLGIDRQKPLIYVTGGSQGAERLNDAVLRALLELLPYYQIFHQVGEQNLESVRITAKGLLSGTNLTHYYYIEGSVPGPTVSALLQAASLVITRAGSTTLFEISYVGKPSIIVPIPEDVSRDQRSNAYAFARGGGATVIEEHNLQPHLLAEAVHTIMRDPQQQALMSTAAQTIFVTNAARKMSDALISIGIEHGS
jgi:UDP-N-acetylglucosamine--N-acetylmuramyl-(pentapeptide) pyrophosphoryl-undecaprenol N-acetylglucosamine transferase